jgi:hypothetical protein
MMTISAANMDRKTTIDGCLDLKMLWMRRSMLPIVAMICQVFLSNSYQS